MVSKRYLKSLTLPPSTSNMDALLKGLLWFIPSLIALIAISLKFFDEDGRVDFSNIGCKLWRSRGSIFILFLVGLSVKIENWVHDIHPSGLNVTHIFYDLEGAAVIVFLQESLTHPFIIHASSIFYVLGLTFFVIFTPLFFFLRGEAKMVELFAKCLAVNYMFILPGYFLLNVLVTSYYSPLVEPLVYSHPQYLEILRLINRQTNCFPSGHISISLTMTLIFLYSTKLKRAAYFGIIFTALTAFVIIYLGVHWLSDIPAGVALALFAYSAVSSGRMDFIFDPLIRFAEKVTGSSKSGE